MKGAAEFLSQMLVAEPENGYLVISPSVSPENSYSSPEGPVALSYGTTMDNELLYELFQSVIEASRILGEDSDFASELSQKLTMLAPLQNRSSVELSPVTLPKTWTYDVPTKAGETITFRLIKAS